MTDYNYYNYYNYKKILLKCIPVQIAVFLRGIYGDIDISPGLTTNADLH